MFRIRRARSLATIAIVAVVTASRGACGSPPAFDRAVVASHPLAFFRLDALIGNGVTAGTTFASKGGATMTPGPAGPGPSRAVLFNGTDASLLTSIGGGVATAGSLMAWVDLRVLPSKAGHIDYVLGESQNNNDFDVQFEGDDTLHFYTAAGDNIRYAPKVGSLVGKWHMIVATAMLAKPGARAIYWDGKLVASDSNGGNPNKGSALSVGESTVFNGRFFNGAIANVAIWDRVVSASQVAAIYASSKAALTR